MKRIPMFSVIIFFLGVLAFLALTYNGDKLSQRISNLQGQNDKLKEQNKELQENIEELNLEIEANNVKIELLQEEDNRLQSDYLATQDKIKNIKPKYEKASRFAANYNADSIRRYFSDLK